MKRILFLLILAGVCAYAQFSAAYVFPQIENFETGTANVTLDASGEYAAAIFRVPRTGTISQVGFLVGTVTTAGNFLVGLETVTSGGLPSGSMYGGSSQVTYNVSTTGWHNVTLSPNPASATEGDIVALTVRWSSGNIAVTRVSTMARTFPFGAVNTGTASKSQQLVSAVRYSDGTWGAILGGVIPSTTATVSYNSASSPNEYGVVFSFPVPVVVVGARMNFYGTSAATGQIRLYDADNTVLASLNVVGGTMSTGGFENFGGYYWFGSQVRLAAGRTYRLALVATDSSASVSVRRRTERTSGLFAAYLGGYFQETSRTGSGSWTNTSGQIIEIFPVIEGIPAMGVPVGTTW